MNSETIWTENQKQALAFKGNQCLVAGAGSGKTLTLVELVLRLVAGRVPGRAGRVNLDEILALTYTEKAAREMRDRVRAALNGKIRESEGDDHTFWVAQRRLLDRSQITTIHSFCLQVLREFGLEAGLDPDFSIQDNSRDFLTEVRREELLEILSRDDDDILKLLDYYPWLTRGRADGLDALVSAVQTHARTYGCRVGPGESNPVMVAGWNRQLTESLKEIDALMASGSLKPGKNYFNIIKTFVQAVRDGLTAGWSEEKWLEESPRLKALITGNWQKAKNAKDQASQALETLESELRRRQLHFLLDKLERISRQLNEAVGKAKESRGLLDFDDLLLHTRALLAENLSVRQKLKQRYLVILVDEFQDTNRLQADIIACLLEPLDRALPVPDGRSALDILSREEGRLVIFGDPKQSIYGFRGAEVTVFHQVKEALTGTGGQDADRVISLADNFRSQKRLVEFFNAFFPQVMSGPTYSAETYDKLDRQKGRRPNLNGQPAVELIKLETSGPEVENRDTEAGVLAARLKTILDGRSGIKVEEDGRDPQPGDVTILLRRFTHLTAYEKALRRAGLPFYTVRGKGFYQTPEVGDLFNLVSYLADPSQGPALLGVLRSPLFGLDDATLTRLAWPPDSAHVPLTDYFSLETPPAWPKHLPEDRKASLERARQVLSSLCARAGFLFPAELVEEAVEQTDLLAVLLALPQGEQKVANVQRFIENARALPVDGLFAPGMLVRFLEKRLADRQDDPEAQTIMEDAPAIRIMTIHQAKGLEFPIVCLPDTGQGPRVNAGSILFGPGDRYSMRFRDLETDETCTTENYRRFKELAAERENAEYFRLLYVALTRARDHLIVSGNSKKRSGDDSWLAHLDRFAQENPDMVRVLEPFLEEAAEVVSPAFSPEPICRSVETITPDQDSISLVKRVLETPDFTVTEVSVNVTTLSQYLTCPRRYYLEYVMNSADEQAGEGEESPTGTDEFSPRRKGILFHHMLEQLDLEHPADRARMESTMVGRARSEGWIVSPKDRLSVMRLVERFLDSDWGRDLLHSRDNLVQRELPLWLKIDPAVPGQPSMVLTGVIDLLYVTPEGRARIVDYKYSAHAETGRYEAQIKCYALALIKAGLSRHIEAGLYFTHEKGSVLRPIDLADGWERGFEDDLRRAAAGLAELEASQAIEPAPMADCQNMNCPFRNTCS